MDILPSHLGTEWSIAIVQERSAAASQGARRGGTMRRASVGSAKPRLGLLGRFWTRGSNLSDAAAANVLHSMSGPIIGSIGGFVGGSTGFLAPTIIGFSQGHPEVGAAFGAVMLAMSSMGFVLPRILLQRWLNTPLATAEIEALLSAREDTLERAYLTLIRDAIRQDVPEQAADEVRRAIRAIGDSIERLPPLTSSIEVDPEKLRQEAARVQAEAAKEPDMVTASSLQRQAEALIRSAQAAERSAVLLRRNAALRQELAAQVEALRLGLAAHYAGAGDMVELVRLAEQVRNVANEANAVADARAELDSYVLKVSSSSVETPVRERHKERTTSAPSSPTTIQVNGR